MIVGTPVTLKFFDFCQARGDNFLSTKLLLQARCFSVRNLCGKTSSWHVFSIIGIYNDIYIYTLSIYALYGSIWDIYIYIYIVDMILYI